MDDECEISLKWEKRIMISVVSTFIGFAYISFWILGIFPFKWWTTIPGLIHIALFHYFTFMVLLSYYRTIVTNPGFVQKDWAPSNINKDDINKLKQIEREKINGTIKSNNPLEILDQERLRYCVFCNSFKPPRSHHCYLCKRCVYRMDHHCPWVANCVGLHNHKQFILFLLYATLGLFHLIIIVILRFIDTIQTHSNGDKLVNDIPNFIFLILNCILTIPISLAICSLFVYQFYCLICNMTSIEHNIINRCNAVAKRHGTHFIWPYDLGMINNLKSIMGESINIWLFPDPSHKEDGIEYRKNSKSMDIFNKPSNELECIVVDDHDDDSDDYNNNTKYRMNMDKTV